MKKTDNNLSRRSFIKLSAIAGTATSLDGISVDFPDFTRGKWKTAKPLGIITA